MDNVSLEWLGQNFHVHCQSVCSTYRIFIVIPNKCSVSTLDLNSPRLLHQENQQTNRLQNTNDLLMAVIMDMTVNINLRILLILVDNPGLNFHKKILKSTVIKMLIFISFAALLTGKVG